MRFPQQLAAGELPVSLEITPPKKRLDEVLLRRARLLGGRASAVHVIQREGRMSSLDASLALIEAGLEPIWHVVSRGRTRAEIASRIASAASGGIGAVLCIRGDHAAEDAPDTPRLREVVAMVREGLPDALVGATANQYGPRARVLANLLPKLRAGASFVQTNPVLDLDPLRSLADELRSRAPGTKIVPLVMPLVSLATAERIAARLAIPVPRHLLARLDRGGEPAGWDAFAETALSLAETGLADAIAIMPPVMDPPPAHAERIGVVLDALRRR